MSCPALHCGRICKEGRCRLGGSDVGASGIFLRSRERLGVPPWQREHTFVHLAIIFCVKPSPVSSFMASVSKVLGSSSSSRS